MVPKRWPDMQEHALKGQTARVYHFAIIQINGEQLDVDAKKGNLIGECFAWRVLKRRAR